MNFRCGIAIINWMNYSETVDCLEFLFNEGLTDTYIVVLENGSRNGSREELIRFLSRRADRCAASAGAKSNEQRYVFSGNLEILLILGEINLGFAGGCNKCISFLSRVTLESIFLLNSDARISRANLEMLQVLSQRHNAIVGPKIFDMDGEMSFSGRTWPGLLWSSGTQRSSGTYTTGYVEGSACMIPSEFIRRKISRDGYVFDERFFLYCEDVDLCLSAAEQGYPVLVTELCQVAHKGSASSGGLGNPTAYYYITRNRILLSRKWLSFNKNCIFLLYYFTSRLILMLLRLSSNRGRSINKAVLDGLVDGFLGRFGARK